MKIYRRRFGVFVNPAVRREIAALDAQADAQRIAHLLSAYEFPWDFARALELALFYTYASDSVSHLLDRTAEFARHGQKRYDDTAILIGLFIESGWDGEFGRRALERMNRTHGHYRIPNDDFLFVLWTFIEFPAWWTDRFGRRRMTAHERQAWFNFWVEVGARMGLSSIPPTKPAFDVFIRAYEAEHLVYDDANRRVADATVAVMQHWFPPFVRPLVRAIVPALMPEPFLKAVGYADAPAWLRGTVHGALKLVGLVHRHFALGQYPRLVRNRKERTYEHGYTIDTIEPVHLSRHYAEPASAREAD